jgi:hypothetical protein
MAGGMQAFDPYPGLLAGEGAAGEERRSSPAAHSADIHVGGDFEAQADVAERGIDPLHDLLLVGEGMDGVGRMGSGLYLIVFDYKV